MRLTEVVRGSGIYKIPRADIEVDAPFIRSDDKDGEVQPLLHICERDMDPYEDSIVVVLCSALRWDTMYGHYKCQGCKQTFFTAEELRQVWADGKGTGEEIHC